MRVIIVIKTILKKVNSRFIRSKKYVLINKRIKFDIRLIAD